MAKKRPYRFVLYLWLELIRRIVLVLPRPVCYLLAAGIGKLVYGILSSERERTTRNLKFAFKNEKSDTEIRSIASRTFVHLAHSAVDVFRFPELNHERLTRLVHCEEDAFAKLNRALARGKGFIGLSAHIGNWELAAAYVFLSGYSGKVVGRRIYYEPFNRVLVSLRRSASTETIYRDEASREILYELKQNHVVGIVPDQDMAGLDGIFVPFFGKEAWTPTAPARLALASEAAVVPMFMIHEGTGYRFFVEDPILPVRLGSKDESVRAITEAWSAVVEQYIRRYPDQWVWMHDRWKTRPKEKLND